MKSDFLYFTFKCGFDLGSRDLVVAHFTLSDNNDLLCQVILKTFQKFKVMERTQIFYGLTDGGHSYNPLDYKYIYCDMETQVIKKYTFHKDIVYD